MKTLNVEAYERIYSDQEYLETDDYSDLTTLLADEYQRAYDRYYKEFKLDKRRKKIGNDEQQSVLHKLALQIEVGLDSSARQFYARLQPPDQTFMNERYFIKEFIMPDEDKSSANSLKNKLIQIRKFIDDFQKHHPIELRKSYRYTHTRLYYNPSSYIEFRENSYPNALLTELFRDFTRIHDSYDFFEEIAKNYPHLYINTDSDSLVKMKKASELINERVRKEIKSNVKLVLHNTKTTSLNPMAFHKIDRIQFDKNR